MGKTTTRASVAIAMVSAGHNVAVVSTDPTHSLRDTLDGRAGRYVDDRARRTCYYDGVGRRADRYRVRHRLGDKYERARAEHAIRREAAWCRTYCYADRGMDRVTRYVRTRAGRWARIRRVARHHARHVGNRVDCARRNRNCHVRCTANRADRVSRRVQNRCRPPYHLALDRRIQRAGRYCRYALDGSFELYCFCSFANTHP